MEAMDLFRVAMAFAMMYGMGCVFCWLHDGLGEANSGRRREG